MSPRSSSLTGGYVMVLVAACGWGTWPLVLRFAPMPPSLQAALVMGIVTALSLPVMLRDRVAARASRADWLAVAVLGVSDALNVVLLFEAYRRTSVAIAVLTHYLTPLLVALTAPLVLREPSGPRTKLAVAASTAGLALLLRPWRDNLGAADIVGAACGAASAVCYAANVLLTKRLAKKFSGSELMFFHGLVATPLLLALVPNGAIGATPLRAYAVVLVGAIFTGTLCNLLFVWGLRRTPAAHASVLTLFEPFVAVLLAAAVLNESLGLTSLLGGVLVLLGAVMVTTSGERAGSREEPRAHRSDGVDSPRFGGP